MARKFEDIIQVDYDGNFPGACSGRLKIWIEGVLVYNQKYCCRSTGAAYLRDDWNECVEAGEMRWEPEQEHVAGWANGAVREAVRRVLSKVPACCGGCL